MNEDAKSKRETWLPEERLLRAFSNGAKCAYGKKFWRWIDLQRSQEMSRTSYSLCTLQIDPSAYSYGINEGRICLEAVMKQLLRLTMSLKSVDTPDFPEKCVLQIMGLYQALSDAAEKHYLKSRLEQSPSIIELCHLYFLSRGTARRPFQSEWLSLWQRCQEATSEIHQRALRDQLAQCERGIAHQAAVWIETYYNEYSDERPHDSIVSQLPSYERLWKLYGPAIHECAATLYDSCWT